MSQRILVSGSKGFIGSALVTLLLSQGYEVIRLARGSPKIEGDSVYWDPANGKANPNHFEDFDAVIHLAGENIMGGLWTKKFKEEIFVSRCRDTWFLSQTLLRTKNPPQTLICASAIGIYGKGFLADLCRKWEAATTSVSSRGIRRVHTRFGLVLSPNGGMLKKILPLFKWGLGAIIGDKWQAISWIALEDVVSGIDHALKTKELRGGVNFTAPNPETSESFSKKLAKALKRSCFFHIGAKPLKWMLGEMAEEVLLMDARVLPDQLLKTGYRFTYPCIEDLFKQHFS